MTGVHRTADVPGRAVGMSLGSWFLFACSGPLGKSVITAGWSPGAVTSARITVAAVVLLAVVAISRPRALRFRRADLWLLLGYGLLGVTGVQLFFFVAVRRVPVGVAMVLVNLAPVLVALWVRFVRRVRLPWPGWLGIGLAVLGLGLVVQVWQHARLDVLGVTAGLAAAVCSAGYFLLGAHGARRYDASGLAAAGLAIGSVTTILLAPPWTSDAGLAVSADFRGVGVPVWLALLVLAVAGTALPYLVGLRALRDLPSTMAGVLAFAEPVFAVGLAWLLLDETVNATQIVGAAVLLSGAVLAQRVRHPDCASWAPLTHSTHERCPWRAVAYHSRRIRDGGVRPRRRWNGCAAWLSPRRRPR